MGGTTATPKSIQGLETVWRSNLTQYAAASGPNTWLSYDAHNNVTQIHVGPNHILLLLRTT